MLHGRRVPDNEKAARAMTRITTMIPAYNQEKFIDATIASAVDQIGDFTHEILVSSDGSSDRTRDIIRAWQQKYPLLVRDVSVNENLGISGNFRHLFNAASGEYIAILEGDDLWTDPEKLQKQSTFLKENDDCSMVFSMIRVKQLPSGEESLLPRQTGLKTNKLDGNDFLADSSMNLIANFSSCMLRTRVVRDLHQSLFRERFNEIAMAFFFERFGPIGFLKEPMSIYHQHENGVWTGSSPEAQLRSGLAVREVVLEVADPKYERTIRKIVEERYRKPLEALEAD